MSRWGYGAYLPLRLRNPIILRRLPTSGQVQLGGKIAIAAAKIRWIEEGTPGIDRLLSRQPATSLRGENDRNPCFIRSPGVSSMAREGTR